MTFQNCESLAFEDLTVNSNFISVQWAGGGTATWTNVELIAGYTTWYETPENSWEPVQPVQARIRGTSTSSSEEPCLSILSSRVLLTMVFFMVFSVRCNAKSDNTMSARLAQSWYQRSALRYRLLNERGVIYIYKHAKYIYNMA
jgi:hypothetical protein